MILKMEAIHQNRLNFLDMSEELQQSWQQKKKSVYQIIRRLTRHLIWLAKI